LLQHLDVKALSEKEAGLLAERIQERPDLLNFSKALGLEEHAI
jgi:hypothetical protein